jgi:hypothetical protein
LIRKDYLERMIEQAIQAIAQIAQLIKAGEFDPAMILIRNTSEAVLGPMAKVLERLDAASAVELLGRFEVDRVRMYAVLLGEEGLIHELRHHESQAQFCFRRSLEFYAAGSKAGMGLLQADIDRIVQLQSKVDPESIESQYRDELRMLAGRAGQQG